MLVLFFMSVIFIEEVIISKSGHLELCCHGQFSKKICSWSRLYRHPISSDFIINYFVGAKCQENWLYTKCLLLALFSFFSPRYCLLIFLHPEPSPGGGDCPKSKPSLGFPHVSAPPAGRVQGGRRWRGECSITNFHATLELEMYCPCHSVRCLND